MLLFLLIPQHQKNVAVGFRSLCANTTGTGNTALGVEALQANTTANSNTAVGP
jgi:trimeric autotransporter adhesin